MSDNDNCRTYDFSVDSGRDPHRRALLERQMPRIDHGDPERGPSLQSRDWANRSSEITPRHHRRRVPWEVAGVSDRAWPGVRLLGVQCSLSTRTDEPSNAGFVGPDFASLGVFRIGRNFGEIGIPFSCFRGFGFSRLTDFL